MENYILELSQQKSENVRSNGDWVTNLADKNIIIEEGDEVSVKNVFLDTVSQSNGKVNIDEDLTLTVGVNQYLTSWRDPNTDFIHDPVVASTVPTGYNYIKSRFRTLPNTGATFSGYNTLVSIEFEYDGGGGEDWGDFSAHFTYIDIHGVTQNLHFTIPVENKDRTNSITLNAGVVIEIDSLVWVNRATGTYYKTTTGTIKQTPIAEGETIFSPETEYFQFTLPKGNYDPTQLASLLSTVMSANKKAGVRDADFVTSAFMAQSDEIDANQFFIRTDGEESLRILDSGDASSTGSKYWVGASQIQWVYDENTKLFSLNFCHFPILDSVNGTDISVRYFYEGLNTAGNIITVTTNGGCLINSLTAQKADGTYTEFWGDTLGFDLGGMTPIHTTEETTALANFQPKCFTPRFNLVAGVNLVNGFVGLDTAVFKNGTHGGGTQWYEVPTSLPFESTISTTNAIVAIKSFEDVLLTSSHFLVELNSTFINNFVNETETRGNIQSIVSRYYGYEQFTSSEGAGSISYIHSGQPVYIKSIGCRILMPDLTISDIGNRNHIYIQVIKANKPENPQPAPPQQPNKK